ncbi:MAG TPA: PEGA domain-containing protein [Polyangiales bacterium]|nr:PEGA domain-containing protein [Polyangiales bacterium]
MVQRSDDKGDKRSSGTADTAGRDAEASAANALRERIRQAGGAATARASDHAPPHDNALLIPNSSAPPAAEHSGIRTRPPEPRQTSITPPLFSQPKLSSNAMSVPWPATPRGRPQAKTRVGLGQPQPEASPPEQPAPAGLGWGSSDDSEAITADMQMPNAISESGPAPRPHQPTPRGIAPPALPSQAAPNPPQTAQSAQAAQAALDAYALSTARTQPMPRVRGGQPGQTTARTDDLEDERRRVELATTRKTQGLLRAPDLPHQAGRYSVHDVSTEYVDSGAPDSLGDTQNTLGHLEDDVRLPDPRAFESDATGAPETELEGTRPRRSTPKQRVGHRRSTRPEIGHARERGTKRTDPGIRARTLRGGNLGPLAPPANATPPPLPVDPGTVVVDPSLSVPPPAASLPVKAQQASGGGGGYVPLPRDREAYEAFLRSAAGEHGGPPRARPSWAQQETALIPRDALQLPPYEYEAEGSASRRAWLRSVLGVIFIAVGGVTLWWTFFRDEQATAPRVHEQVAPAARAITLIATEPPGAEVLLDGAVIGNTPLEVTRPVQGEALYLVRMKNFEHQMVRVTNGTHNAIHITLQPVAEQAAPAASNKR